MTISEAIDLLTVILVAQAVVLGLFISIAVGPNNEQQ